MNNLTVLVIEDGKIDFLVLKNHLESLNEWKVKVLSAETFEKAHEQIKSIDIDICLLSYYISGETADEFLNDIILVREYIPVILISSNLIEEANKFVLNDKVDDYLSKSSISKELLTRSIRYCLSKNSSKQKVLASEQKYFNLFNNSLEAIFTADENFKITRSNLSFKKMMEVNADEEFDFRKLFPENDYEQYFTSLSSTSKQNTKRTKLINSKGEVLQVYLVISRILNRIDDDYYQVVIHDITDLERAEQRLHENEKTLLIQRMARIIGHEVRNPLTNVILATEELKQDFSTDEDAMLMLDLIHRNSSRISSLIDKFLKNTKNADINLQETVIEDIIYKAFENCKDRIVLKQVTYQLTGLNNKTIIPADSDKLEIVFTNIIINALEALEKTINPKLEIKFTHKPNSPILYISDNGSGMNNHVKLNLFNPFYSNKQGGLGLGMSNAKNILDEHKAKITVESEEGKGTIFKIVF